MKIAIVGAGIIGITCATRILEFYPETQLTIISENNCPSTTTSAISAGLWMPYCVSGCDEEMLL